MLEDIKEQVCQANLALVKYKLVILTWGNVSAIDRESGLVVIKPSGVSAQEMQAANMVVVDLQGKVVEGKLRPSSDTPAHLEIYQAFTGIGGITHTHSTHATMFAQADSPIPCFGTTHADYFYGEVPVTRQLRPQEVEHEYEANTGRVVVEHFAGIKPLEMPAVLVANHGAFTWGIDAVAAVEAAIVLEEVAGMALGTLQINMHAPELRDYLLSKHYLRKHGKNAYYGQF